MRARNNQIGTNLIRHGWNSYACFACRNLALDVGGSASHGP